MYCKSMQMRGVFFNITNEPISLNCCQINLGNLLLAIIVLKYIN